MPEDERTSRMPHDLGGEEETAQRLSRRTFLKASPAVVAAGAAAVTGCEPAAPERASRGANARPLPLSATAQIPPPILAFFSPREAAALEAFCARIIPGDVDDPGAREAGVIYYIDRMLSSGDGYAEPTYQQGPFAATFDGDTPPNDTIRQVVWVEESELGRYGYQSPITPRDFYRLALAALDEYATVRLGSPFAELTETQQDTIVDAVARGNADGFTNPAADDFFETVRQHTIEGMFSDPLHGGNRDMVGWKLIGFPGAQRAYTPRDMLTEGTTNRTTQSLRELPVFNPGQPDRPEAVYPVRGTHQHGRSR